MTTSSSIILLLTFITLAVSQSFYGPTYQKQGGSSKQSELNVITFNDTSPGDFPNILEFAELFIESMDTSFDYVGDDMPSQFPSRRPKLIHSVGAIADAQWLVVNNNLGYTGLFKSGCKNLYARLSLAKAPSTGEKGYAPGLSLKFLRSGVPSGNMFAMFSLQGQDSWNFFANDLTNHVPDISSNAGFALAELRKVFEKASDYPVMIGLSDLASYDESGNNYTSPKFPFRLIFHPTTDIHNRFPDTPEDPFEEVIADGLSTPGPLYYVYAETTPGDLASNYVHIATIVTTDAASTSHFADKNMFFQHTRMENDFVYRPEWQAGADAILAHQRSIDYYTFPNLPFN